jgi:hypothetical protein
MANGIKGFLSNPIASYTTARQPGGFLAPTENFQDFLSDPRTSIGIQIAQGVPIGQAILGGALQAEEIKKSFQPEKSDISFKQFGNTVFAVNNDDLSLTPVYDIPQKTEYMNVGGDVYAIKDGDINLALPGTQNVEELAQKKFQQLLSDQGGNLEAVANMNPDLFLEAYGNDGLRLLKDIQEGDSQTYILSNEDVTALNKLQGGFSFDPKKINEIEFYPNVDTSLPITEIFKPENIKNFSDNGKTNIYTGKIPKDIVEAAAEQVVASQNNIGASISLLQDLQGFGPASIGVSGVLAKEIGGFFGAIDMPEYEQRVNEFFNTQSSEAQKQFRSQANLFVSRNLRVITGDESGRYTDREREIAEEAIGILGTFTSFSQAVGAIKSVIEMELIAADRNAILANSNKPNYKPTLLLNKDKLNNYTEESQKSIENYGRKLVELGFSEKQAYRIISKIELNRTVQGLTGVFQ